MPYQKFNRDKLILKPLSERKNKVNIEADHIPTDMPPKNLSEKGFELVRQTVDKIKKAKALNRSVMLTFGAHTIKNGMAPTLIALMNDGWLTHLATNGAGIIHDWEFSFLGKSSEDVRENVKHGEFGTWQETGYYINLAIVVGAYEGLGYGESVGKMISNEGLQIPDEQELLHAASNVNGCDLSKAAAALDLLGTIRKYGIKSGFMSIPHPFKKYSVQARAYELGIPFTAHPMIGHDIIYVHPLNNCAAIGRAAQNDFLSFANSVSNLENGVYMSIGSAVMSPMIFEKSMSMTQNVETQLGRHLDNHFMLVVDLAESEWDWNKNGEPPMDNPAYYLRYCKTFSRMGGEMHYLTADNRDFLLALYQELSK